MKLGGDAAEAARTTGKGLARAAVVIHMFAVVTALVAATHGAVSPEGRQSRFSFSHT
jgi:hypothetical protein